MAAAGAAEYERGRRACAAVWMVLREQHGIAVRSKARSATWPCAPPANARSEHPLGWGQMEIDEARALEPEELGVLAPGAAEHERGRVACAAVSGGISACWAYAGAATPGTVTLDAGAR